MDPVFYEQRSQNLFVGSICDHPYPPHVHDVVEVVCPTSGRVDMTITGVRQAILPGQIAIIFPNVPHSYDDISPDTDGLAMIFQPDVIQEFNQSFRTMLPVLPLIAQQQVPDSLATIVQRLGELPGREKSPLFLGYLHLFLSYVFTCIDLQPRDRQTQIGLSCQALQYISEHFTEPLTLETTARALGISRIHLSHLFSQQLNINFRQYINTLRIARACTLLLNPAYSISEIAYMCGYGNPRTFHRAFFAQCHMQPSQYREKHAERADVETLNSGDKPAAAKRHAAV